MELKHPALAMLELASIGRGLRVVDDVVKKAPVQLLAAEPLSAGKFMVLFGGNVASVEESLAAGMASGADAVINSLFLPNLHPQVLPALDGPRNVEVDSLAIVETSSIAAIILSADAAAKAAEVELVHMRLAQGIGGKGFFTLNGPLPDIEAAIEAATAEAERGGWLIGTEIVARPHPDTVAQFVGSL